MSTPRRAEPRKESTRSGAARRDAVVLANLYDENAVALTVVPSTPDARPP